MITRTANTLLLLPVAAASLLVRRGGAARSIIRTAAFVCPTPVCRRAPILTVDTRRRCVRTMASASAGDGDGTAAAAATGVDEAKLVQMHSRESARARTASASERCGDDATTALKRHLDLQRSAFDAMAEFFDSDEAIPDDVVPLLRHLADRAVGSMVEAATGGIERRRRATGNDGGAEEEGWGEQPTSEQTYRVLDVGCGTGALFRHYLVAANERDLRLNVTAVDISPEMARRAKVNADMALDEEGGRHSFEVLSGDFVSLVLGESTENSEKEGDSSEDRRGKYDAVVINACFGNFLDVDDIMSAAAQALRVDGVLCITHPLGAAFVKRLHEEDPTTVPNTLPNMLDFLSLCRSQPLAVTDYSEEAELLDTNSETKRYPIYFAGATRTPFRALDKVIRLRGPVGAGYGRGGKKLGFPTANLPSSLFQDALENVPTGVYVGWALIEDSLGTKGEGRNTRHKAVVNVGYSPTFEGDENKEKIVEAHLIVDDGDIEGDFYNETMRLALSGFIRPEMKFPSFLDLVAQIKYDVQCAKDALMVHPFAALGLDTFVSSDAEEWIGVSGGDNAASWEFQNIEEAITHTHH